MTRRRTLTRRALLGALLAVPLLGPLAPAAHAGDRPDNSRPDEGHAREERPAGEREGRGPARHPLIFVHGSAGSGGQYETQAQRFASNGFPADWIDVLEYDSTFTVNTRDEVYAALDQRITELLARTGAPQVDLLAHSLGTFLSVDYLGSTPERPARVAHYVNYDGVPAAALPGGVATLAVWGQGPETREIVGATNVRFDQSHTQVVTSAESFAAVYAFLEGAEPRTTAVVPARGRTVAVSGRAALFPQNVGVSGARLEVYPVASATGGRLTRKPVATKAVTGDGSWGPFRLVRGEHYEFVLVREGAPQHHFYMEPFVRDDRLVRLLTSEPGTGIGALVDTSEQSTALVVTRNKEWWGDQGEASDRLAINGQNILNPANAPQSKRDIGLFVFDDGSDGATNLTAPVPEIHSVTFMTGIDVFVPAADQPASGPWWLCGKDKRVRIEATPRGGGGRTQVVNVPNWRSSGHRITVQFHEYV
jgi:pimeloyl-ACP methyl ester carboxylesterase